MHLCSRLCTAINIRWVLHLVCEKWIYKFGYSALHYDVRLSLYFDNQWCRVQMLNTYISYFCLVVYKVWEFFTNYFFSYRLTFYNRTFVNRLRIKCSKNLKFGTDVPLQLTFQSNKYEVCPTFSLWESHFRLLSFAIRPTPYFIFR